MSWEVLRFASPHIDFRLRCTKGTYVRTLAHDLGAKLGCGAHLSALRRTATDKFTVASGAHVRPNPGTDVARDRTALDPGAGGCAEFCAVNRTAQYSGLAEASALAPRPLHLAIGMFDGVHRGHRAVIDAAVESARRSGGLAAVLTFWPHPSALFRPENPTLLMQDAATKARVLHTLGLDAVITETFTAELAGVAAEEFLPWLKSRLPGLRAIYVGENFRFGRGRRGDVALMAATAQNHGLSVFSAPRVCVGGEPISSTRIRELLVSGEIAQANELLGYAYFSDGIVAPGKQLGRTIGFPTLNVAWAPGLRPRHGVYAVRVGGAKSATALPACGQLRAASDRGAGDGAAFGSACAGDCPYGAGDE
jgi:riboflavin kinase/FMN adenylyltransferase